MLGELADAEDNVGLQRHPGIWVAGEGSLAEFRTCQSKETRKYEGTALRLRLIVS
jgi:hypothetical protein